MLSAFPMKNNLPMLFCDTDRVKKDKLKDTNAETLELYNFVAPDTPSASAPYGTGMRDYIIDRMKAGDDIICGIFHNIDTSGHNFGFGICTYLPGAAPVKSGFFDKCRELGSTKYIFCGHDHENNASVWYEGITMTYGLKTGPSPAPWNHAKKTGDTLITLKGHDENQSVSVEHIVIN